MKVKTASYILNSARKFFRFRSMLVYLMLFCRTSSLVWNSIQGCFNAYFAERRFLGCTWRRASTMLMADSERFREESFRAYLSYLPRMISLMRRFKSRSR
jgi:hypothetical protein